MSAKRKLLRLYVRLSRRMPAWMTSQRAQAAAIFGAAFVFIGAIADLGDFLDFVVPGRTPATSHEISALQKTLLAELRAQGITLDAPAESAIGEALAFFQGLNDPRVNEATKLMQSAPSRDALKKFEMITQSYVQQNEGEEAAEAWRALGALAFPVDRPIALNAYERARKANPNDAYTHFTLGVLYQNAARLDDAKAANDKTVELARAQGEPSLAALARMQNGVIYKQRAMIDEAEAELLAAAGEFESLNEKRSLAIAYSNLGDLYSLAPVINPSRQYNRGAPEQYYAKMLNIGYELRDPDIFAAANLGLGVVWRDRKDYFQAIVHFSRALGYFEWNDRTEEIGSTHLSLGLVALELEDSARAKFHFSKSLQLASELKQPLSIATARLELSLAYLAERDVDRACREISDARKTFAAVGSDYIKLIDEYAAEVCSGGPVDRDSLRNFINIVPPRETAKGNFSQPIQAGGTFDLLQTDESGNELVSAPPDETQKSTNEDAAPLFDETSD